MAKILYLVHRMPYPPNKGDKVRSYHLLRHLAAQHQVFLGAFVDDPEDLAHVDTLRQWCADVKAVPLNPRLARLASLRGLLGRDALTLHYYRHAGLQHWVDDTVVREGIGTAVVFSSSMAQYAQGRPGLSMLVDFVDVDSAKWSQYAAHHAWPLSWLYRREGRALLAYERRVAQESARAFFVTEQETALFRSLAPECAPQVEPMCNGVDADYFAPDPARASPFAADEQAIVFTGAMDYWPNVDAVQWFVAEMLPALRARWPRLRFHIVGRSPTPAVRALAGEAVNVTGTVPDVRPYLQHAAAVVAPLRLARGIQNKVLEAMAMAQPVVAARSCAEAIGAEDGQEILFATEATHYVAGIDALLGDRQRSQRIAAAARRHVLERYSWRAHLSAIEPLLSTRLPDECVA
ncbi:MAG: sugar transferase [Rubrivivax sp. SCN 71-131]|nr:MAG: sugar transferase [Rubrivivax sp. SCN 71-131]